MVSIKGIIETIDSFCRTEKSIEVSLSGLEPRLGLLDTVVD